MKIQREALEVAVLLLSFAAMAQRLTSPQPGLSVPAVPVTAAGTNLPLLPIGMADLIHLTVSDSPELSQSFRVDNHGNLNLPLLRAPMHAQGLLPDALGAQITVALRTQHLLVNPVVAVTVVEYRSRAVTISGAVKTPATIQELGDLHVLNALAQAGGLLPEAGTEVIVEQPDGTSRRLPVRALFDGLHPALDILLTAGAQIRVPQGDQVYVVGNVRRPGAFPFRNMQDTTVLQLLALSGGLDAFARRTAYIYRTQPDSAQKKEIEVPLRRILDRKADDVRLVANDILYIPTNGKLKAGAGVLNHVTGIGNTAVSAAIWSSR